MGRWQELQQAMSAGVEAAIDAGSGPPSCLWISGKRHKRHAFLAT